MREITAKHLSCKIAALSRSRATDDLELIETRRQLSELMLSEHIAKACVSDAGLTDSQRQRLIAQLSAGAQ